MHSSKHIHKNSSFLKRTFLSFITVTIIITILLTGFLTLNYMRTSLKLIYNSNDNILAQSNYSITYINELAQRLSHSLYNDKDIVAFLNSKTSDTLITIRATQTLDKHLVPLSYVDSVYLYNADIDTFISTQDGYQYSSSNFYDKDVVKMVSDPNFPISYDSKPIIHDVDTKTGTKQTCSYVMFATDKKMGKLENALIINLRTSTLTQSLQSINQFSNNVNMQFLVVDSNGVFLLDEYLDEDFHNKDKILSEISQIVKKPDNKTHDTVNIKGTDYLLSYNNNNSNNWYIFGIVPQKNLFKDVTYSSVISLIVVIILFLITAFICLLLARQLNSPIKLITKIVGGQKVDEESLSSIKTDEFKFLTSVFQTMKTQNDHFSTFKSETAYSLKQDLLNNLVSGNLIQSLEKTSDRLDTFNLSYMSTSKLCMCILKIDEYNKFYSENNQKERWALRYAVVNVACEIFAKYFTVETFSTKSDKFVVIIKCDDKAEFKEFKVALEHVLAEIGSSVKDNIGISLSIAYSTIFNGLEHLSSMYKNLEELIQMKMKYGHGCIISPYILDDLETEYFQIPLNDEDTLTKKINAAQKEDSLSLYQKISSQLFEYSSDDVVSYMIHLAYTIYATVQSKNPGIKQEATSILKNFMVNFQKCEIFSDIDALMNEFISQFCDELTRSNADENMQNSDIISRKICEIIENQYSSSALCMSSIADELKLSPNYIGHVFKSVKNTTISKYISDIRMDKVAYYLQNTKLTLSEIAQNVGMEKNNYFYTCFKRHFGMPLSDYKKIVLKQGK